MSDSYTEDIRTTTTIERRYRHEFVDVLELRFRPETYGFSWSQPFVHQCYVQEPGERYPAVYAGYEVREGEILYTFARPTSGALVLVGQQLPLADEDQDRLES